jgi:hypothetical protein
LAHGDGSISVAEFAGRLQAFPSVNCCIPWRSPSPSFRACRANVQNGFGETMRSSQPKVSLQVSHPRLFEVLALQAPTDHEPVVTKSAVCWNA